MKYGYSYYVAAPCCVLLSGRALWHAGQCHYRPPFPMLAPLIPPSGASSRLSLPAVVRGPSAPPCSSRFHALEAGIRGLYACVFAFLCTSVHAGYANVSPPSSWDFVPVERGGRVGQMGVRVAANDAVMGGVVRASERVAVNVGARSVTMPVAYRVAANASTVAARFAFGNPALFVGAGLAAAAYYYYNDKGYSIDDAATNPHWVREIKQYEGRFVSAAGEFGSLGEAFAASCGLYTSEWSGCHLEQATDWQWSACAWQGPAIHTCAIPIFAQQDPIVGKRPAELSEFEQAFGYPVPLPDELPSKLPTVLPVDDPILNPSADPVPVPQPLRVPMGEPQPVPNTVPEQWRTPAIDIVPAPSEAEPWRVDIQPVDVTKSTPDRLPDSYTIPVNQPPDPDSQVTPKPESEQGLCVLFPDILACAKPKFDTPNAEDLPTKDVQVQITPDTGWGASDASCPAPRRLRAGDAEFSFQPVCDFMHGIRPVVIAISWLIAAYILIGANRGAA